MEVSRSGLSKDKGFTLIELVVVIVILSILAEGAVPKFINMQDEAEEAAILTRFAAFQSAVKLYHSGWLAAGNTARVTSLESFGKGDVSSTPTGWPYGTTATYLPGSNGHQQLLGCIELWNSLTDTDFSVKEVNEPNPVTSISEDIGVSWGIDECIYISSYFAKKGTEMNLTYNNVTGDSSVTFNVH